MSFFAYILENTISHKLYKGHCENLESRLKEHYYGHTKSTRHERQAWQLIYYEKFKRREEAIARERYFKTAAGRRFLKEKLSKTRSSTDTRPERTVRYGRGIEVS